MKLYESQITAINSILYEIEDASIQELKSTLNTLIGFTLTNLQKTEFIIHGIVSLASKDLLNEDKRFVKLNPRNFLDDNPEATKSRKQTLGIIMDFFLKHWDGEIFQESELRTYVKSRNKFIHSLWRDYLSNGMADKRERVESAIRFIVSLIKEDRKWQILFQGFMYEMIARTAKLHNKPFEGFDYLKKYHDDFLEYAKLRSV